MQKSDIATTTGAMSGRRSRWSPLQLVAIVVFGVLGPLLAVGAFIHAAHTESLRSRGVGTNATVVADSDHPRNKHCTVRLTDAGGRQRDVTVTPNCGVPVGGGVQVVYDPHDPTVADFPRNLGTAHEYLDTAFMGGLGLSAGAVSVWALRAPRERFADINRRSPRWRKSGHRPTSHRRDD